MSTVLLSSEEALLRSTEEQAAVLLAFYEDTLQVEQRQLDASFVERRRQSLRALGKALRERLSAHDILPKQQDMEVSAWHFFLDRVQGLLRDEPLAVPLAEERKLLDLCDALEDACADSPELRRGRAATLAAVTELTRGAGQGDD